MFQKKPRTRSSSSLAHRTPTYPHDPSPGKSPLPWGLVAVLGAVVVAAVGLWCRAPTEQIVAVISAVFSVLSAIR